MADSPKLTWLGKLFIFAFIAGCAYGAFVMFVKKPLGAPTTPTEPVAASSTTNPAPPPGRKVQIGIAYGTEKQRWMQWAVDQFNKTDAGRNIQVNLIGMGSLEGAQALLAGDQRINVWSPASALYKDVFVQEWNIKYNANPILREEALALTPMVFVFWQERYEAFASKYNTVSFDTIGQALKDPGGWDAIAHKPDWGLFKFGHTHPGQSNSGLMTLTLLAYEYQKKSENLTMKDILTPGFQTWMNGIESGVSGLSNSTGNMMRDMVLRGPSSYDALFVYENVVIDYLKNAEGRWGDLRVVYPKLNMWNDNPYYVIDAPWSSKEQREAAGAFLDFLLTEPIQREALNHGFRPGNPDVPIKFPESPFTLYQKNGLQVDISTVCAAPKADVVNNLLAIWQRTQGSK
ncbi:MAG: substrate-binding domain-containing protein [Chthoniobacteraceae bacterium]